MKSHLRARMVRIAKETEIIRGTETVKVVYFTVADRSQTARKNADGTTAYITKGFYFCKAYGKQAELIIRDFGKKDENGKLISRAIYLEVEPQPYKAHKEIDVKMSVPADALFAAFGIGVPEAAAGKSVDLVKKEKVEYTDTVYVVKSFEYDDYAPKAINPAEVTITLSTLPETPAEEAMEAINAMEAMDAAVPEGADGISYFN